ncbi:MAG: hypothetical protein AAF722_18450 [Cyanobacteria bacterium P01_C01_bin.70]
MRCPSHAADISRCTTVGYAARRLQTDHLRRDRALIRGFHPAQISPNGNLDFPFTAEYFAVSMRGCFPPVEGVSNFEAYERSMTARLVRPRVIIFGVAIASMPL